MADSRQASLSETENKEVKTQDIVSSPTIARTKSNPRQPIAKESGENPPSPITSEKAILPSPSPITSEKAILPSLDSYQTLFTCAQNNLNGSPGDLYRSCSDEFRRYMRSK